MLSATDIAQFEAEGCVRLAGALSRDVARRCVDLASEDMGLSDAGPWPEPVVRGLVLGEAITEAANSPRLNAAVGQLLEGEAWHRRPNLGLLVVRTPFAGDPGDTGWHIDSSFQGLDTTNLHDWWVNYRSQDRGLLLLCLLSEVGVADAPTRVLRGSHRKMPPLLKAFGEGGVGGSRIPIPPTDDEDVALATGEAGDVYLCHPFLVHAASWPHRGTAPRYIAQPPISIDGPLRLDPTGGPLSVVARTVRDALDPSK